MRKRPTKRSARLPASRPANAGSTRKASKAPGSSARTGRAAPQATPRRGSRWALVVGALGLSWALWAALDVQQVGPGETLGALRSGDYLLLDRVSGELGRVGPGQVVAVRRRGPDPYEELRRVRAVEGALVDGRDVERGHVALAAGRGTRPETVPVGDVVAVARLRVRRVDERWAVDLLPPIPD